MPLSYTVEAHLRRLKLRFWGTFRANVRTGGVDSLVEGATLSNRLDRWTRKPKSYVTVVDEMVTKSTPSQNKIVHILPQSRSLRKLLSVEAV